MKINQIKKSIKTYDYFLKRIIELNLPGKAMLDNAFVADVRRIVNSDQKKTKAK